MSPSLFYSKRNCLNLGNELSSEIQEIVLIKQQSLLHNYKLDNILIIGPGKHKIEYVNTPDLVILLNPNLMALDLNVNQNYMIVLNSNKSKLFKTRIIEIANLPNVLLILNKHEKIPLNNRKIQSFEMEKLKNLTLKGNGLNLLPIALLSIIQFYPKVLQIVGCDFYLGLQRDRNITDIVRDDTDINVQKTLTPSPKDLAFHNPFDQLTCSKVLFLVLENRGCEVFFDYKSLTYDQMTKRYKAIMARK
jgi:hypothetical protein